MGPNDVVYLCLKAQSWDMLIKWLDTSIPFGAEHVELQNMRDHLNTQLNSFYIPGDNKVFAL